MDALVTDEGDPWNPNDKTVAAIDSLCTEALKVIKPGGALIQISFQQVRGDRARERENERECVGVGVCVCVDGCYIFVL